MQLAIVLGRAVAPAKHETMQGSRLLVVQPIGPTGRIDGDPHQGLASGSTFGPSRESALQVHGSWSALGMFSWRRQDDTTVHRHPIPMLEGSRTFTPLRRDCATLGLLGDSQDLETISETEGTGHANSDRVLFREADERESDARPGADDAGRRAGDEARERRFGRESRGRRL